MTNDSVNVSRSIVIRGPMLAVAGAFVGGILAGRFVPLPAGFWWVLALAGLVAGVVSLFRKHLILLTTAALLLAVFSLGAVRMKLAYFSTPSDAIVTFTGPGQILATVRGRVASYPWISHKAVEFGYQPTPAVRFLLEAQSILTRQGWRKTSGLVRVTVDEPYQTPQPGLAVELIGKMGRYRPPRNPGQFDAAAAAQLSGTMVHFRVPCAQGLVPLDAKPGRWWQALQQRWRALLYQRLTDPGDTQSSQLVAALVLGERHPALAQLNRTMKRAGLAHFMSISGMHLGVLLGFIYLLCRVMCISPKKAAIIVLIALAAYLVVAQSRPPLLRSAVMATALSAAVISGRKHSSLNALAVAAVGLLAFDPRGLLLPGFQLSFTIVVGIILLHKSMERLLFGSWLNRRGLMVFRDANRVRHWLRFSAANWGIAAVSMCVTAYLAAAPLVAYHFGLFSPYAIVLGLVVFPLVVATLVPGYLALALAWPMPNLSAALASLADGPALLITKLIDAAGTLPVLAVQLRPVSLGWVLLCYGTIVSVLPALNKAGRARRIIAGLAVVALIALSVWTQLPAGGSGDSARLHMLAVGAGQCVVLQTPAGQTYILDAGTRSGFDVYRQALEPFMRAMKLPDPAAAFVSHANTDHYSALPGMTRAGLLQRVYLCDYFDQPGRGGNEASMRMVKLLKRHRVKLVRLRAGDTTSLGPDTRVETLWPPAGRAGLSENDTSLVLRIICQGQSVLLTGDLAEEGQAELLKPGKREQLRSDILVLPHHGAWTPTLPEFVAAVKPGIILVSSNHQPQGPTTAGPKVREFYKNLSQRYRFYSTARDGWVALTFGKTGLDVQTMRQRR